MESYQLTLHSSFWRRVCCVFFFFYFFFSSFEATSQEIYCRSNFKFHGTLTFSTEPLILMNNRNVEARVCFDFSQAHWLIRKQCITNDIDSTNALARLTSVSNVWSSQAGSPFSQIVACTFTTHVIAVVFSTKCWSLAFYPSSDERRVQYTTPMYFVRYVFRDWKMLFIRMRCSASNVSQHAYTYAWRDRYVPVRFMDVDMLCLCESSTHNSDQDG